MTPQEQTIAQEGAAPTKRCASRQCEQLGIPQPLENFAKNRSKEDGLQSFCRKCLSRVKRARERSFPRIPDDQIKICSECKVPKPALEFFSNRYSPDGVGVCCKLCAATSTAASIEKNKDHYKAKSKEWASNNGDKMRASCRKWNKNRWAIKALGSCRNRAAKKGLPFDMTTDDLLDKETGNLPISCPIFPHIVLDYRAGGDQRLWASVDKIVPKLGYVSGNVWVISKAANTWKSNGSNRAERERIVEIMTGKKHWIPPADTGQGSLFDL